MTRTLAMLVLVGACAPDGHGTAGRLDCVSRAHCDTEQVCFFGRCVAPGYSISQVYLETMPPNDSEYLPQVDSDSPRDLSQGLELNLVALRSEQISGRIRTAGGTARAGQVTWVPERKESDVRLPARLRPVSADADAEGQYRGAVVPGNYWVTFTPIAEPGVAPRPPYRWSQALSSASLTGASQLVYPTDDALVGVRGTVVATRDLNSPKAGVAVSGSADGPHGTLSSAVATTGADGEFLLWFPPQAAGIRLLIHQDDKALVPQVAVEPDLSLEEADGTLNAGTLSLDIAPNVETVSARVQSAAGDPIGAAKVIFNGTSVGAGSFVRTAQLDAAGEVATSLLPGAYDVIVAPPADQPFAMNQSSLCIEPAQCSDDAAVWIPEAGDVLSLRVTSKVQVYGTVRAHDGTPAVRARIVLRAGKGNTLREFAALTDEFGRCEAAVDPALTTNVVTYELTVEPQQGGDAPLPRHRQWVEVGGGSQRADITLFRASLVFGKIIGTAERPLSGARIDLYSVDLGSAEEPLLIGSGNSNDAGDFVIPIPTPL